MRWAEETEEHQGSPDSVEKVESALYLSGGAPSFESGSDTDSNDSWGEADHAVAAAVDNDHVRARASMREKLDSKIISQEEFDQMQEVQRRADKTWPREIPSQLSRPHPERWVFTNGLEMQKKAQVILTRKDGTAMVLLGPQQVAQNQQDVENLGITFILSLLDKDGEYGKVHGRDLLKDGAHMNNCNVVKTLLRVSDCVDDEKSFALRLHRAVKLVVKCITNKDRKHCVLIHCASGVSRAPALAIAVVMQYRGYRVMDAYREVKTPRTHQRHTSSPSLSHTHICSTLRPCSQVFKKRNVINPNNGFFRALLEYDRQLFGKHNPDHEVLDTLRERELASRSAWSRWLSSRTQAAMYLEGCIFEYNAFQLVAQLRFLNLNVDEVQEALTMHNGAVEAAATWLLNQAAESQTAESNDTISNHVDCDQEDIKGHESTAPDASCDQAR